jgi:CP family cyanate transporter-like MFS transporter
MASLYAGGAVGIVATIPLHQLLAGTWRTTLILSGLLSAVAAVVWWLVARNPPAPPVAANLGENVAGSSGRVWANAQLWLVALLVTTMNVFFYTLGGWLPTIFAERGSSPEGAGFLASLPYFLAIPATFVVPVLSDRVGRRKPFLWLLAGVAALASYGLLVMPLSWGGVLAAVLGFATAGILVVCYILPVELVEVATLGRASGFIISVGFLGGIVGPLLAGILRDLTQSFASVIVLLILTAVSAAVLTTPLRETGRRTVG